MEKDYKKTVWKIHCMEDNFPGLWRRWFINQCVAVGWKADWEDGYPLEGHTDNRGWSETRNRLKEMEIGDYVLVTLKGNKVGRIGQITKKRIQDDFWHPLVPPTKGMEDGEMGRIIDVRWLLDIGPSDQNKVIQLPEGFRFSNHEVRKTIAKITSHSINSIIEVLNNPENWVNLLGGFSYERSISDYISKYPHELEEGMLPHPRSKIREQVFSDKSRADVVLVDKNNIPVIVECKQGAPQEKDIDQLSNYIRKFQKEMNAQKCRGILVHGGAAKLSEHIINHVKNSENPIELIRYSLDVQFSPTLIN